MDEVYLDLDIDDHFDIDKVSVYTTTKFGKTHKEIDNLSTCISLLSLFGQEVLKNLRLRHGMSTIIFLRKKLIFRIIKNMILILRMMMM